MDFTSEFRRYAADKWLIRGSLQRDECSGCGLRAVHDFVTEGF